MYRILLLLLTSLCWSACSDSINASKENSTTTDPEYSGMFMYMADANVFFPCDGSGRMSIAMTGAYLTLERKYTALAQGSGERIFVRLEGSTKEVPAMEGDGTEIALVVSRVLEIDPSKKCP